LRYDSFIFGEGLAHRDSAAGQNIREARIAAFEQRSELVHGASSGELKIGDPINSSPFPRSGEE